MDGLRRTIGSVGDADDKNDVGGVTELIQPEEVRIDSAVVVEAQAVCSPLGEYPPQLKSYACFHVLEAMYVLPLLWQQVFAISLGLATEEVCDRSGQVCSLILVAKSISFS